MVFWIPARNKSVRTFARKPMFPAGRRHCYRDAVIELPFPGERLGFHSIRILARMPWLAAGYTYHASPTRCCTSRPRLPPSPASHPQSQQILLGAQSAPAASNTTYDVMHTTRPRCDR
ncbi:hypothetical protein L226DRAFT_531203 [Lentinus tigrinus ALCF2SS1-7]|uniref:Uncharacterized protein n=1 Tax=Lentinus tigrinus ALCF2SS1-6 TaxID=1328759 RepID=A0A5C2SMX9_9APHY|nr:hypothetical protein L227DRAFT_570551 [Lentinus tigrinus ALCF2SS1-6]RPD79396.1 hypothetical protein L226DRAFT_531203 [Lentinus tigrinus ALCF2SS1-7]